MSGKRRSSREVSTANIACWSSNVLVITITLFLIWKIEKLDITIAPAEATLVVIGVVLWLAVTAQIVKKMREDQTNQAASKAQAELQKERLTTLVNNLTNAIISLDSSGAITLYNAATLNLLDTNTQIDMKHIDDILPLYDGKENKIAFGSFLRQITAATTRDDLHTIISGEPMRLELVISPIRAGHDSGQVANEPGWIMIMRDITTAKSLEEERDEFISVVSHELRTPITVAEGTISNVQLMMDRGKDFAPDKIRQAVDLAHDQVVFLAHMVNDLSTLSRAERGVADSAEEIDVDEMIHAMFTEYDPQAREKGLALNLHIPAKIGAIHASRLYLKELLQNFITNAIKYTREGSITIEVKSLPKSIIKFAVIDTGIGISKADQKRVFEKFYRAEDYRTRETSGTGLGLYVANKLARKLGAKIDMKSRLNHGSTFTLAIPRDSSSTQDQS